MKKNLSIKTKVGIIIFILILISRNFGLIGIGVLQTEFYYHHYDTAYAYHDAVTTSSTTALTITTASSSSSSVEVIKQQILLVNNSLTTTTTLKNIQTTNNITTDDHEPVAVSSYSSSLKQHEIQVIDSNVIVDWENDLILNEKVCGVWKCFIPIKYQSNLSSILLLQHNNNEIINNTLFKEEEIDNDIGWLVIKDGKYSIDGTGISIKDAMYETYILSEKIRRQYHIPHLLIYGPPKILINLTLQQRQLLNSKKKKKKKNSIISSSSINSTATIANNNYSYYSLIVQPVKKLRKGSFLLIRYYDKQSKTGTKYIRHFCIKTNLNTTRLSEELLLQKQLLDDYPLLAMDYQLLLFADSNSNSINIPITTSNNNDDDDHDDYSHSHSHHAIAYNFDLDRYYQYYDKMIMNNNTSKKLIERKITVQSWLESISKKILLL